MEKLTCPPLLVISPICAGSLFPRIPMGSCLFRSPFLLDCAAISSEVAEGNALSFPRSGVPSLDLDHTVWGCPVIANRQLYVQRTRLQQRNQFQRLYGTGFDGVREGGGGSSQSGSPGVARYHQISWEAATVKVHLNALKLLC